MSELYPLPVQAPRVTVTDNDAEHQIRLVWATRSRELQDPMVRVTCACRERAGLAEHQGVIKSPHDAHEWFERHLKNLDVDVDLSEEDLGQESLFAVD